MAPERLLLSGGTLIDGTGAAACTDAALLIGDGRIRALGARADVERGLDLRDPALRVIDVTGKTVMPGLIDSHCHINYGEVETEEELDLYTPMEYRAIRAVWNAQKVLRAGVTSVCDPGSTGLVAVAARDAIEAGMFEGPRVRAHVGAEWPHHTGGGGKEESAMSRPAPSSRWPPWRSRS